MSDATVLSRAGRLWRDNAFLFWSLHIGRWTLLFRKWSINHCTRRQLKILSDDQLKDIGVTPVEAAKEAAKPFWMS